MKSHIKRNRVYSLIRVIACISFIISSLSLSAFAEGYIYNSYGDTVTVPVVYKADDKVIGANLSCGDFKNPSDMCIDKNGDIYITDTGNNRIIILDDEMNFVAEISEFTFNGEITYLSNPSGVFVDGKLDIYISDTDNERIICCTREGAVSKLYEKPEISQFEETMFLPNALVVDRYGNVYAQCKGIYQGLIMFNSDCEYEGFFGSETVKVTPAIQLQYMWKSIMNKEQKEQVSRYVPTEIKGIEIDSEGFIYTVASASATNGSKNNMDSIRRLNTKGEDILVNKMNPSAWTAFETNARSMNFVDISADKDGFITLLDSRSGHILTFDSNMQLLDISGGLGDELGKFRLPISLVQHNDNMYILDQTTCSVTKLSLTEYGKKVKAAILLYESGKYTETVEAWEEIIVLNSNFEYAYIGLGNAYLSIKDYKSAIDCFEKGRFSQGYNEAFKYLRKNFIRNNFYYIVIPIIVVIVLVIVLKRRVKKNVKA